MIIIITKYIYIAIEYEKNIKFKKDENFKT
jgi:hypothetical protein